MGTEKMDTKQEQRNKENEEIREMGTMELGKKGNPYGIQLLTIIGEIDMRMYPEIQRLQSMNICSRGLRRQKKMMRSKEY